ncbi:DUF2059 domain-containing protein [Phaeovulum sp. W22_SRMD_FR3]|uniref:DUF2059 domain-containing protein n=1 Tax=Phaeovulum sp. W22_SRMD_FR3 TaxID=3240274 RepID=UPI003F97ED44
MSLPFRLAAAVFPLLCATTQQATAEPADVLEALRLQDVLAVMAQEGAAYGEDLQAELFPDKGGASWAAQVAAVHDPARLRPLFDEVFAATFDTSQEAEILEFLQSDLGKRIVSLEIDARRALQEPGIEEAANAARDAGYDAGNPRLRAVEDFIERADLIEPNVTSGMNANLAFYRAMVQAGGLSYQVTESDMLAEIWGQEPAVREQMNSWVVSYLFMAYAPLSDAELERYAVFSTSTAGRALNRALFAGFDAIFVDSSTRLGAAAGGHLAGEDL